MVRKKNSPTLNARDFVCPQCGNQPVIDNTTMARTWSGESISTPWFSCVNCRLCDYSRTLTRHIIMQWYHRAHGAKKVPFQDIYKDVIKFLENDVMTMMIRTAGYSRRRFVNKKRRRKSR